MKDTCKNCGGDYGLHHYQTMQCPVGGVESPLNRKQEYMDTRYEEDTHLEERVAELERKVKPSWTPCQVQNANQVLMNFIRQSFTIAV